MRWVRIEEDHLLTEMNATFVFRWTLKFFLLLILFEVFFIAGSTYVSGLIPDIPSDPGVVTPLFGLLIVGAANVLLVILLVQTSLLRGLKLMILLGISYFGVVTFLMQIETWYFLTSITVGQKLLPRLFLMGMPVAFLFIPIAVWIIQRGETASSNGSLDFSPLKKNLFIKLGLISISYLILYWCAGYFIAWQNPDLREFYEGSTEILPFWNHTMTTIRNEPWLFPFQILRALLWTLFALPIVLGSRVSVWQTAIILGLLFSVPQNIGHLLENPLIPIASIRLSHLVETASSTFIFGFITVLILLSGTAKSR